MAEAKKGDTVHIHYTGRLQDGTVFDSSREREPISFELGAQKVIPGFEKLVEGMAPGDTKTGTITPEDGYGERRDDMVMDVDRESLPDEIDPEVGQQLQMHTQQGQAVPVQIAKVEDDHITVDANHPLAGRTLEFDVEVIEVESGDGEADEGGGNIITP